MHEIRIKQFGMRKNFFFINSNNIEIITKYYIEKNLIEINC